MNALEIYLEQNGLDRIQAMNHLQQFGVVSDNAVFASDVTDADCKRAVVWLWLNENPVTEQ